MECNSIERNAMRSICLERRELFLVNCEMSGFHTAINVSCFKRKQLFFSSLSLSRVIKWMDPVIHID